MHFSIISSKYQIYYMEMINEQKSIYTIIITKSIGIRGTAGYRKFV